MLDNNASIRMYPFKSWIATYDPHDDTVKMGKWHLFGSIQGV